MAHGMKKPLPVPESRGTPPRDRPPGVVARHPIALILAPAVVVFALLPRAPGWGGTRADSITGVVLAVILVGLPVMVGVWAQRKGYGFWPWFLISLPLTAVIGSVVVVLLKDKQTGRRGFATGPSDREAVRSADALLWGRLRSIWTKLRTARRSRGLSRAERPALHDLVHGGTPALPDLPPAERPSLEGLRPHVAPVPESFRHADEPGIGGLALPPRPRLRLDRDFWERHWAALIAPVPVFAWCALWVHALGGSGSDYWFAALDAGIVFVVGLGGPAWATWTVAAFLMLMIII